MKMQKMKAGLIITLILTLGLGAVFAIKHYSGNKPNIILITFDALRADHLGCYGYPKDTSPFLDSLSRDSLTFTHCITQSASTVPAVSAIFTGHYPYLDGVVSKDYTLGKKYVTIAELLKQRGYRTFAIPGHYQVKKKFGFSRGFDYFAEDHANRLNAGQMYECLVNLFKTNNMKNRFFLWVHIREPHAPYSPPEEYITKFSQPPFPKISAEKEYNLHGDRKVLSAREVDELIAAYDGNIRFADDNLKKIFNYLARRGFLRNTIIIITADHAECLGEQDIIDHNNLFYAALHIPLIVKIPGHQGKLITYPVCSVDIFPTILDLLGYKRYGRTLELRGRSLLEKRNSDYPQFSEYPRMYSLIKGNWQFYLDSAHNVKVLFDIVSDPHTEQDLMAKRPGIYKALYADLVDILKTAQKDATTVVERKNVLTPEDIEQLRSLGYLH